MRTLIPAPDEGHDDCDRAYLDWLATTLPDVATLDHPGLLIGGTPASGKSAVINLVIATAAIAGVDVDTPGGPDGVG